MENTNWKLVSDSSQESKKKSHYFKIEVIEDLSIQQQPNITSKNYTSNQVTNDTADVKTKTTDDVKTNTATDVKPDTATDAKSNTTANVKTNKTTEVKVQNKTSGGST